jgi:hypothetical protein
MRRGFGTAIILAGVTFAGSSVADDGFFSRWNPARFFRAFNSAVRQDRPVGNDRKARSPAREIHNAAIDHDGASGMLDASPAERVSSRPSPGQIERQVTLGDLRSQLEARGLDVERINDRLSRSVDRKRIRSAGQRVDDNDRLTDRAGERVQSMVTPPRYQRVARDMESIRLEAPAIYDDRVMSPRNVLPPASRQR